MDISNTYINLLKNRDRGSFEMLYDNYAANLLGVLSQILQEKATAEDVLQDAFIKIYKNIDTYDPQKGALFTWMLNICRNSAIDRKRKIKREQENVNRFQSENVNTSSHVPKWSNDSEIMEKRDKLNKAIEKLPEDQRTVIENLYFEGMTQREMAEHENIPLGTVKSRIRLGLRKLREGFKLYVLWM